MTETYKVRIVGPGINVDRQISESQANHLLVSLLTPHAPVHVPSNQGSREPTPQIDAGTHEGEGDSIAEYLSAVSAKTSPEKIAAIGVFLQRHRKMSSFGRDNLEIEFPAAGESVPKNLHRDIKNTIRERWIAVRPGEKGAYYVTKTGIQAVNSKFQMGTKAKSSNSRRRKIEVTAKAS
jgi:hypothetical protein